MSQKLNAKQKAFVKEYLICRNATEAHRRVYGSKNPDVDGPRLLGNAGIQALIQENEKKVQEKFEITQDRIIKELASIAFFNPLDVIEWSVKHGVKWKDSSKLERQLTAAIDVWGSPRKGKGGSVSLKNVDKIKALELLGKQIGMWKDNNGQGTDSEARKALISRVSGLLDKFSKRGREADGSDS